MSAPAAAGESSSGERALPVAVARADKPLEIAIVPVAGGNSDIGIGAGAIGTVARHDGYDEYVWRAQVGTFTTVKVRGGSPEIPFTDHYVNLIVPELFPGLRVELRPAFTLQRFLYSGLGNASPPPVLDSEESVRSYQYQWTHPSVLARFRLSLPQEHLSLLGGGILSVNWLSIPSDSVLAREARLVGNALPPNPQAPFAVLLLETGLLWDSRDDEIAPTCGQRHELKLRMSPGPGGPLPFDYGQIDATLQGYITIVPKRLVLAGRAVADVIFGDAPIYELSRFEETNAIGGATGVRGVPAQRYYGKAKIFGNLETRSDVWSFRALKKDMTLGVVSFIDGGRVWADLQSLPQLDGRGLGIHWGAGGGLRLRVGKSLVLRGDVAYSPDANPLSAYFQADHIF